MTISTQQQQRRFEFVPERPEPDSEMREMRKGSVASCIPCEEQFGALQM